MNAEMQTAEVRSEPTNTNKSMSLSTGDGCKLDFYGQNRNDIPKTSLVRIQM